MKSTLLTDIEVNFREVNKVFNELMDHYYTMNDVGQTYRVINHWDEHKLLPIKRKGKKGWRKFTWFDLIWIETIKAFREFGVPLAKIRAAMDELFSTSTETLAIDGLVALSKFELTIVLSIVTGKSFYFLMDEGGKTLAFHDGDRQLFYEMANFGSMIILPVSPLVAKVKKRDDVTVNEAAIYNLNAKEAEALELVKANLFDKIILYLPGEPSKIITKDSNPNLKKEIINIFLAQDYEKLLVFKTDGRVISLMSNVNTV